MADPRRHDIYAGQHMSGDYATSVLHIEESVCGNWIKWADFEDYKAAQRRNKSLETNTKLGIEIAEVRSRLADLEAENERLRKAGDFMFRTIDENITVEEYEWIAEIESAWNAAKEGGRK